MEKKLTDKNGEQASVKIIGTVTNIFKQAENGRSIGTITAENIHSKYVSRFNNVIVKGQGTIQLGKEYEFKGHWVYNEKYKWSFLYENFTDITPLYSNENSGDEIYQKLSSYLTAEPFKISLSRVDEIYAHFKGKSLDIVRNRPFELYSKIKDIELNMLDMLFENSTQRVEVLVNKMLDEINKCEGHAFYPYEEFKERFEKEHKSKISNISFNDSINELINKRELIKETFGEETIIYSSRIGFMEEYIAEKLNELSTDCIKIPNLEQLIQETQKENNITYAEKQIESLRSLNSGSFLIITGGPGTGKSTIIKAIEQILRKDNKNIRVKLAAPTGRAAKRVEESTGHSASTIHRLLDYHVIEGFRVNDKNPLDTDVLIVDEFSMVDIPLMYYLLKSIKRGTKVIVVGDVDQLPPVGVGYVLRDMIDSGVIPTTKLNAVFRQGKDSYIKINAAKIREGKTDIEAKEGEFELYLDFKDNSDMENFILRSFLKSYEEETKKWDRKSKHPIYQVQILCPMRIGSLGVNSLNKKIQAIINPPSAGKDELLFKDFTGNSVEETIFRTGDKVMQMTNNTAKGIFNGDLAIIKSISSGELTLKLEDGSELKYLKNEVKENLTLAYATTVHKSQGSEYNIALILNGIIFKNMLQRNLLYTAVTRAKKKAIIIGDEEAVKLAIDTVISNNRKSRLKYLLETKHVEYKKVKPLSKAKCSSFFKSLSDTVIDFLWNKIL